MNKIMSYVFFDLLNSSSFNISNYCQIAFSPYISAQCMQDLVYKSLIFTAWTGVFYVKYLKKIFGRC